MRKYLETHPWLTFSLNLAKLDHLLWMALGEAQSKCEHLAGVPLRPSVAKELYQVYLTKGIMATTAIEGNTLSEGEVRQRIEGRLQLPPSKEYLGQEVDNVLAACHEIRDNILQSPTVDIDANDIKNFNRLILRNLPLNPEVVPGKIRNYPVGVGKYRGAPPEDCEFLLQELCSWLNQKFDIPQVGPIATGILKAIIAHLYIAWIHPFGDGNGRTARLLEFQILLSSGVPDASAQLLSNYYNQTRTEYYRQLDQAHQRNGNLVPFLRYALQGFIDGLKEQLALIRNQQLDITWRNYVHETFRDKTSPTDIRRRHLVLDLSLHKTSIPIPKLRHISSRVAEAYAGKTQKTLIRDVNALCEMELLKRSIKGVEVKREKILAFLPASRKNQDSLSD